MTPSSSQPAAILSYYNVTESVSGGMRRINELIQAIGTEHVQLFQPGSPHRQVSTFSIRPDFGVRRLGINWGMFNYAWPSTALRVRNQLSKQRPKALVLTSIWTWAPFVQHGIDSTVILDAQNVDAVAIAERYGWKHPFTRLVMKSERRVVQRADSIITCSDHDRDLLIRLYATPAERIHVVPNGAAIPPETHLAPEPLDADIELQLKDSTVCLFIGGKLDYPPNAEGLRFISDVLLPTLERNSPASYKVIVVGAPVPKTHLHPNILSVGRVESLDPWMRRSDIALAPIFSGSGTRLKTLDYLAWAKPVVATPKAVEGTECQHGRHALLCEADSFAEAVESLRKDKTKARQFAMEGRKMVQEHYEWSTLRERWHSLINPYLEEDHPKNVSGKTQH